MKQNRCSIPRVAARALGELMPRLLGAIVVSCLVTGCAQFPNPTAQTATANAYTVGHVASPSNISPDRPGSRDRKTEHLGSRSVHNGNCGGDGIESWCYFSVKGGTAAGPFPGTFNAHVQFRSRCQPTFGCGSSFSERFTIISGSSRFSGNIDASGEPPGVFEYTTDNGYSGKVKIYAAGLPRDRFNEKFYGM